MTMLRRLRRTAGALALIFALMCFSAALAESSSDYNKNVPQLLRTYKPRRHEV